ncbi:MAG: Cys-tRNA(Pro) deacylase [Fenollaria timonensis]
MKKTNAMRLVEAAGVDYEEFEYDASLGISGTDVARTLNEDVKMVFKTLVTETNKGEHFVFIVPVAMELDLKKAAKAAGAKKVDMLKQRDLLPLTGYVHGGCSPIGMKTKLKTFIDASAMDKEYIYVSGGKIGLQIKLSPEDLVKLTDATAIDIVKSAVLQ